MPYCIYLRKSRKDMEAEQQGAGETLARHRAVLTELAARRGLLIEHIYQEIVSGDTIDARPVMQQLLADVQGGRWEGVLVMEIERLARGDTIDQGIVAQTFKYSGTCIITPARDYDPSSEADEEYFEFGLFMSRREYQTTRRRLLAGRIASVREGKYLGTRAPFGYERYKLKGEKGWSLRIVPEKAELVRMIFRMYLQEDTGAQKIANRLNAMGIRTDLGHAWTANRIRSLLREPVYIGKVQWYQRETKVVIHNGQRHKYRPVSDKHMLVDGRHEAIVDQETWEAVQAIFASRRKSAVNAQRSMLNPLAGLVKCSICGKAMVRTPMYGHLAGVDYLKCSTVGCATSACPLSAVENMILDGLREWLHQYESGSLPTAAQPSEANFERGSMQRHLEDLEKRRARLMDLLEQGIYDAPTYVERSALLAREIEATKSALAAMPKQAPDPREQIGLLLPKIRHVLQAYHSASSSAAKNALLSSVLSRVVYHKTHICKRSENPADFVRLDLYPKTE